MTVRDNVGFALKLRRIPAKQMEEQIRKSLTLVEMDQYIDRYPGQLSGGQQQRVALARTLAYNPAILLLDEPLSNLDAKLRDKARSWLRRLQTDVGITTIFVTHDQVEALALSDRIAVMDSGRVVQIGKPREIYERPATPFVADFIGTSNFVTGIVVESDADSAAVKLESGDVIRAAATGAISLGSGATVAFRPERVEILPDHSDRTDNVLNARVTEEAYLGSRIVYSLEAAGTIIRIETLDRLHKPEMLLRIPEQSCAVFAGAS
jgi:iron(III) transport system ATP-binding protein